MSVILLRVQHDPRITPKEVGEVIHSAVARAVVTRAVPKVEFIQDVKVTASANHVARETGKKLNATAMRRASRS